jgi:hypothetical protein
MAQVGESLFSAPYGQDIQTTSSVRRSKRLPESICAQDTHRSIIAGD